jgi:uncharacterized membrane protein
MILEIFNNYKKLIFALFLTIAPITELRVGLPLAMDYAFEAGIPVFPVFFIIVLMNILLIFFLFFFLDKIHYLLLSLRCYRRGFDYLFKNMRKKADKLEKRHNKIGFFALMLFVAVPLPGTGAWTGCLVSWILGLERKKSIMAIAAGVMIAGLIIFTGTLGARQLILLLNA